MQPSVGRIVHYTSYGTPGGEYTSQCRAAIITAVNGRAVSPLTGEASSMFDVDLCVLNPEGMFFNRHCVQSDANTGGTWHWPEVVNA